MANYTGQQRFLLQAAEKYSSLEYNVGLAKGKEFLQDYEPDSLVPTWFGPARVQSQNNPDDFDGISLIPLGIVCVDIDIPDFGAVYEGLPPTLKEKTPRGWHLFYYLDPVVRDKATPKIKWRQHVDLLTIAGKSTPSQKKTTYGGGKKPRPWGGHIVVSPTPGYTRIWPDEVPIKGRLTEAPVWLQDALIKP